MSEVLICKEVAEGEIKKFAKVWGVRDNKAILSQGKESSIPEELTEILTVSFMMGNISISESGETLTQTLEMPIEGTEKVTYTRQKIKKHNLAEAGKCETEDQMMVAIAGLVADVEFTPFLRSELTTRDTGLVMALAAYISFT